MLDDCLMRLVSDPKAIGVAETPPYTPREVQSLERDAAYFTLPSTKSFPATLLANAASVQPHALNILITDDNAINRKVGEKAHSHILSSTLSLY
jgi:hypothetical protein